jgi:hypothetical protein
MTVSYRIIPLPSRARAADDDEAPAANDENCEMNPMKRICECES